MRCCRTRPFRSGNLEAGWGDYLVRDDGDDLDDFDASAVPPCSKGRAMPSFDVVSQVDKHEVANAVQQARKEVTQRFDFRGTETEIEQNDEGICLRSEGEGRLDAALKVLEEKLVRRKVSLKVLDVQDPKPAGGKQFRQVVKLKEGIDKDRAKKLIKILKESKLKVQASIQGDVVRVTGKKKDDLQATMDELRGQDLDLPLQFINFRD